MRMHACVSEFALDASIMFIIFNYERSSSLLQYCFRNSDATMGAFLFHPASEDRYVRVNAEKMTLDIFCCRNKDCVGNSKKLKLTKQKLSQLKFTRESLIRKHNRISVNESNESQHVCRMSLMSPKLHKHFFE